MSTVTRQRKGILTTIAGILIGIGQFSPGMTVALVFAVVVVITAIPLED